MAVKRDPQLASDRARQDAIDSVEIERVHDESRCRYGARKNWRQLRRERKDIARCTVERLMKVMGQLELETLKWVDWYNTKRLHSATGYITPHEAEEMFYETLNTHEEVA